MFEAFLYFTGADNWTIKTNKKLPVNYNAKQPALI